MTKTLESLGRVRRINLARKAYDQIKEAIVFGKIKPGEALSENVLAQALDMSRTPIREALKELSNEDLVDIYPGRGAFAREVSSRDLEEICELRTVLECQAACSAVDNMTDNEILGEEKTWLAFLKQVKQGEPIDWETLSRHDYQFHAMMIGKCQNTRLKNVMKVLSYQSLRYQVIAAQALNNAEKTIELQLELIDLLKKRDKERLVQNIKEHIEGMKEIVCYSLFFK